LGLLCGGGQSPTSFYFQEFFSAEAGLASHAELLAELERITRQACADEGLELVELALRGSSRHRTLRVDVDRAGPRGVGLGDCERVSRRIETLMDEADPIAGSYRLEVSSPGIDRPIRSSDDVRRNIGRRVAVTLVEPDEGRRVIRGVLMGGDDDELLVDEGTDEPSRVPRRRIEKVLQELPF
jgi:ribosome maturation factor RimP